MVVTAKKQDAANLGKWRMILCSIAWGKRVPDRKGPAPDIRAIIA
jgi:hypothetical protein